MKISIKKTFLSVIFLLLILSAASCSKDTVDFSDKIPPKVVLTYPTEGTTNVGIDTEIYVQFDESIDPSTVDFSSFLMNNLIMGRLKVNLDTIYFYPTYPLKYDTKYSFTVSKKVTDIFGNHLKKDFSFSFTTEHDNIPPMKPAFSTTYFITNSNPYVIGGLKDYESGIEINGEVVKPIDNQISFTVALSLKEGINNFTLLAFDKAGNKSESVNLTIVLDTVAPTDPTLFYKNKTRSYSSNVTGVKDSNSILSIKKDTVPVCEISDTNKEFSCNLQLDSGENNFTAFTTDYAGNKSSVASFTIIRDINAPSYFNPLTSTVTGNLISIKGTKEKESWLFYNGIKVTDDTAFYNNTYWELNIYKEKINLLNFSLTDDLSNSNQFLYTIINPQQPKIISTYPSIGSTFFSSEITEIVVNFNTSVTVNCQPEEIINTDGTYEAISYLKPSTNTVILKLKNPIVGTLSVNMTLNSGCFYSDIPDNPQWWKKYSLQGTSSTVLSWNINVNSNSANYSQSPSSATNTPVEFGNCNYYSCQVTINPFYSYGNSGIDQLQYSLKWDNSNNYFDKITVSVPVTTTIKIPPPFPFACNNLKLNITNINNNTSTITASFNENLKEYNEINNFTSNINRIKSLYIENKQLLVISLIHDQQDINVYIIKISNSLPTNEIYNFTTTKIGYSLAISKDSVGNNYLLLGDPSENKLAVLNLEKAFPTLITTGDLSYIDLSFLNSSYNISADMINSFDLFGNLEENIIISDSYNNIFIFNSQLEFISKITVEGLSLDNNTLSFGFFAVRGKLSPTLCIGGPNGNNGNGEVDCFLGGKDFPQNPPYISVRVDSSSFGNIKSAIGKPYLLGDYNNDGIKDLITSSYHNSINIFSGGDYPDSDTDYTVSGLGYFSLENLGNIENGNSTAEYFAWRTFTGWYVIKGYNKGTGYYKYSACYNNTPISSGDILHHLNEKLYIYYDYSEDTATIFSIK